MPYLTGVMCDTPAASNVTFVSLEDETGDVQLVVWQDASAQHCDVILGGKLLAVKGEWQREGEVRNIIVSKVQDQTHLLGEVRIASQDFH